jgi:hypothetical protein
MYVSTSSGEGRERNSGALQIWSKAICIATNIWERITLALGAGVISEIQLLFELSANEW